MASISKRVRKDGSVAWQVQIRIEGRASVSKTFDLKEEAELFCEMAEKKAAVLSGKSPRHKASVFYQTPFREVIPLYLASPENKGQHTTSITVLRQWMGDTTFGSITPGFVAKYIKNMSRSISKRGTLYSGATIIKHLNAMAAIYKWYAADHEIAPPPGLFSSKQVPRGWNVQRNRRLLDDEYQRIVSALETGRHHHAEHLKLLIDLALETGARMNEMILAESSEFDLKNFLWCIPARHTKSKTVRNVPLSDAACQTIARLNQLRPATSQRLFFCFKRSGAVSMRMFVLFKSLHIEDLRFHDLRHEAISRMVLYCRHLSVYEIMQIVGHKSIEMLHRYANLRPEEMISRFRMKSKPDYL